MVVRGLAGVVGAVLALALVVSGCSGEGESKAGASSEQTATVTPTQTALVVPEDETAEEFIRRWFEVGTAFQNSGDPTGYLAISRNCLECQKTADIITGFYEAGGFLRYGGEEVLSVKERKRTPGIFEVVFAAEETVYKKSQDSAEQRLAGGEAKYVVTLELTASGWQVSKYLQAPVP